MANEEVSVLGLGMHRTRVQTGNPGFGHSRLLSFPILGIPGLALHLISTELINNEEFKYRIILRRFYARIGVDI
jgi:hypothetical protein